MGKELLRRVFVSELQEEKDTQTVYYDFFVDGTYRCNFWDEGAYSEWKIENGNLWVLHPNVFNPKWDCCKEQGDCILMEILETEMAMRRMLLE